MPARHFLIVDGGCETVAPPEHGAEDAVRTYLLVLAGIALFFVVLASATIKREVA